MVEGKLSDLQPGEFGIVLGENLAASLNARVGDKITVVTPKVSLSPAGAIPRFKRFTVVGIFHAGNGFGFDRGLGFASLADVQRLMSLGDDVSGLHLSTHDVFAAPRIANDLQSQLTGASVTSWADQFGEFFHAVQLEKTMMFFILLLIIAVAAFNLVSTLMMVVSEKESDIAILRTYGATPNTIMSVFIVQGAIIGIFGTLFGLIGGLLLASNVTVIVNWLQDVFHVQLLSANVYFVNYLPSEILFSDVSKICLASLFLSLIATVYPAWRASKMDPVESLRYE
jgi:lipoprotein-releasing system permease protein